ncbi:unnamed protein product [Moneuplotes crassus]|uniref:Uncharacterized protein n=1 Tax=Euplotes crassus TaxID=5936 RepID=A0AAD1XZ73_EUPCR|nr:unnamed protein product [Moneuplotes crassus]
MGNCSSFLCDNTKEDTDSEEIRFDRRKHSKIEKGKTKSKLCSQCNQLTNKYEKLSCCKQIVCKNSKCYRSKSNGCPNGCSPTKKSRNSPTNVVQTDHCEHTDFICSQCDEIMKRKEIHQHYHVEGADYNCVDCDELEKEYSISPSSKRGDLQQSKSKLPLLALGSARYNGESALDDESRRILMSKTKSWANVK